MHGVGSGTRREAGTVGGAHMRLHLPAHDQHVGRQHGRKLQHCRQRAPGGGPRRASRGVGASARKTDLERVKLALFIEEN